MAPSLVIMLMVKWLMLNNIIKHNQFIIHERDYFQISKNIYFSNLYHLLI